MEFDMLIMMLEKMFALPIIIMLLSLILKVVKDCMLGNGWEIVKTEEETKEEIKEEVKEKKKKINIDKDLQKYFNYKE